MTRFKCSVLWILLLITTGFDCYSQDTLLLFHPTAYNIQVIERLEEEGILNLTGYHVLGVYHELETYDYQEAADYIDPGRAEHFSLVKITGAINPETAFTVNACTGQFTRLFRMSLGALFMGGPDIPPALYNEPVHLLTSVTDPYRHYFEASYLFHLLGGPQDPAWSPLMERNRNYLVSGICLGMQTMNVATGGSLVQDIPTEIYGLWLAEELLALSPDQIHRNYNDLLNTGCDEPTSYHFHHIQLSRNGFLKSGLHFKSKSSPLVLSSHHQALEVMGEGWKVAATSVDGKIVEAIEHESFPYVFGVQFHPEKPGLFDPSIEHPNNCSSTINFQESIKDTDSYAFHLDYWKYVGAILQQNKAE